MTRESLDTLSTGERAIVLASSCCVLWATLYYGWSHVGDMDFSAFARSAAEWRSAGTAYRHEPGELPNLNAPLSVITIFAWLPLVSERTGYIIWAVISAACLAWTCRRVAGRLDLPQATTVLVLAACLLSGPARLAWMQGQVTWVLLPLLTEAWLAERDGHPMRAGAWLVPVVAIKPTFALFALLLSWRVWVVAGLGSAALTIVSIVVMGSESFRAWLSLERHINWAAAPANASLWGLAGRFHAWRLNDVTLSDLPVALVIVVVAAGGLLAIPVLRARGDRRWLMAYLWVALLAPLAWVQYLPWLLGPLVGVLPWPRLMSAVFIGSFVPWSVFIRYGGTITLLAGSVNALLVAGAYAAIAANLETPKSMSASVISDDRPQRQSEP